MGTHLEYLSIVIQWMTGLKWFSENVSYFSVKVALALEGVRNIQDGPVMILFIMNEMD